MKKVHQEWKNQRERKYFKIIVTFEEIIHLMPMQVQVHLKQRSDQEYSKKLLIENQEVEALEYSQNQKLLKGDIFNKLWK